MKRTREKVRGLNWSIRLERLEDRLPLDGGLGAISQNQLQSINFDYLQIQYGPWTNLSSAATNSGASASFGQPSYSFDTASVDLISVGLNAAENRSSENLLSEVLNVVRDRSLTLAESSGTGYVPIPNPIMIPLPDPTELIAVSKPIDWPNFNPTNEPTQIAKVLETKASKAIERPESQDESNHRAVVSTQSILENVEINSIESSPTIISERVPTSIESSPKQPMENVRSVNSEPIAQTREIRANRISWDRYYEKTDAANERQELRWSTDESASATRQQVISQSSALLAIVASNTSKSSMSNNPSFQDADPDLVEPNTRLVSHIPNFESRPADLESNPPAVADNSNGKSNGSVEIGSSLSTNDGRERLHSSWGTYVLVLVGMTLSLASSETREIPSEPELLTSKKSRPFPFGKESM